MNTSIHPFVNTASEFSVSELSRAIKGTMEHAFSSVRVRGELTGVTHHPSGHIYMELKDENSTMRTVCWRSNAGNLAMRPENGLDVIISGRITTYDKNSTYQLTVSTMEVAGVGALLKLLEDRKKALQAEGVFEQSRKKSLPYLPRTIGVITSPTGAVIRDILHRVADRYPLHVLVYPAKVQGQGTETDVVNGIAFFNACPPHIPRPDVIIVARGGGSMQDLWAFNDESIVRAVADSHIPIVSAIGHETDTTLMDYVSDRRAPTPTAAAELVVPVQADIRATLDVLYGRMQRVLRTQCDMAQKNIHGLRIPSMGAVIQTKRQKLHNNSTLLKNHIRMYIQTHTVHKDALGAKCVPPTTRIQQATLRIAYVYERLKTHMEHMLHTHKKSVHHRGGLLESYSYKKTLHRGFSLVYDTHGNVVHSVPQAQTSDTLHIHFADGSIWAIPTSETETHDA